MSEQEKDFKPEIIRTEDGPDFAAKAARYLWQHFEKAKSPLIVLPTGNTPCEIYKQLVQDQGDNEQWKNIHYISLDDYAGLNDDDERLFKNWLAREILDPAGVPLENRHVFNSNAANQNDEASRMEQWIADHGPIDVIVLGLGTNGHIGFNEPGSSFGSTARVTALTAETREANAGYWGGDLDKVPTHAFTLGLKTIAQAKKIILLVNGAHKADILDKVLNGPITETIPATILRTVPNVTVIADKSALKP